MHLYLVVKDETDYNGDRTYPRVFKNKEKAEVYCSYETEKAEDWYQSMLDIGERVGRWIPSYHIEEVQFIE